MQQLHHHQHLTLQSQMMSRSGQAHRRYAMCLLDSVPPLAVDCCIFGRLLDIAIVFML